MKCAVNAIIGRLNNLSPTLIGVNNIEVLFSFDTCAN